MMEADESSTPDIVADNYAVQVMSVSLEYLGQNPRRLLYTLKWVFCPFGLSNVITFKVENC